MNLIGNGLGDEDFASLLQLAAWGADLKLEPDPRVVADGLSDNTTDGRSR
jgi:hypothetical protein